MAGVTLQPLILMRFGEKARLAAALVAGIAAGFAFTALHLPLPWLLGPFLTVTVLSLSGLRTEVPALGRSGAQIVIGCAVGLYLTAELVHEIAGMLHYIIGAAFASIALSYALALLLVRVTGVDRSTAFFGSMPGGVADMSVLADAYGGNTALVALAQAIRIAVVVSIVPPAIFILAPHDLAGVGGAALADTVLETLALLAGGCALSFAISRTGFVNHAIMGGILAGALVAYFHLMDVRVPALLLNAGQLLVGVTLGARFTRDAARGAGKLILAVIGGLLAFLVCAALLALAIAAFTGIDPWTAILATMPGGIAEASITAKSLHLGVGEVAAFHLVRILLVITLSAPLFTLMGGGKRGKEVPDK